ncbi:ribonucleotide reductase inhibitor-domain-containing protein [Phyllosticta capitalensis]
MSPSQHRSKRPFQPSITNYFARSDRSDADTTASPSSGHALSHQQKGIRELPASIQSSLLNVGMRVRKAVPEGYQTHNTKKIMAPAFNSSRPPMENRSNELLPFCGIHKTGGLALQPSPIIIPSTDSGAADNGGIATNDARPLGAHDPIFDPAFFSSSSDSNASIVSADSLPAAPLAPHKRRFVDDDSNSSDADDEGDLNASEPRRRMFPFIHTDFSRDRGYEDAQVSPRTRYPVSHTVMPDLSGGVVRPFARPRTRKRDGMAAVGGVGAGRRHAIVNNGTDFEDAEFLQPCNDWHDDKEVEMSDV